MNEEPEVVSTLAKKCSCGALLANYCKDGELCVMCQLAQQTELLRRALEVIEDIVKARDNVLTMGILAFAKAQYKAQALASDLRAALEALEEKP